MIYHYLLQQGTSRRAFPRIFCSFFVFVYHAPQEHYLPEKILPETFLKLPLPDLSFAELISKNYPIPSVFVWVAWRYPPKTPVLVELFLITVTRFEVFRVNWVMFSWQIVFRGLQLQLSGVFPINSRYGYSFLVCLAECRYRIAFASESGIYKNFLQLWLHEQQHFFSISLHFFSENRFSARAKPAPKQPHLRC